MDGLLGQSDGVIRLVVFAFVFLVMALIELAAPKLLGEASAEVAER